ncbi:MAG: ribosome maturation factor RimM [Anaerovoracaceae bacterium]
MGNIEIGIIVSAVGMKGEVKLKSFAEDPARFEYLESVFIGDEGHRIENVRYKNGMVILKVSGIDDRDAAERVKNRSVYMSEDDLEEAGEGEYYIRDLLGLEVCDDEKGLLGVLEDIRTQTAQPLFCIRDGDGRIIYLPGVPQFIRDVDMENGRILVKAPEGLLEI